VETVLANAPAPLSLWNLADDADRTPRFDASGNAARQLTALESCISLCRFTV